MKKLICILAIVTVISGCASGAKPEGMSVFAAASIANSKSPLKGNVAVRDVTGGQETNPAWKSNIASIDFERALELSLQSAGLLALGKQAGSHFLTAHIENVNQPLFGVDMTVTATIRYLLSERATGRNVYSKTISLPYTATFSDAFNGAERLRLANEGAAKINIKQLIDELVELNLLPDTIKGRPRIKRGYEKIGDVVSLPSLNTETEVEIGSSMVSTFRLARFPAIKLKNNLSIDGAMAGKKISLLVPSGLFVKRATDSEGSFFQSSLDLTLTENGTQSAVKGGIYLPSASAGPMELYWDLVRDKLGKDQLRTSNLSLEIGSDAIIEQSTYEEPGPDGFKRELIYAGVSQNTISILYREFLNDLARPAFSQELKYDLSQGNTIGFKGSRFQVLKATNIGIRYRILKHLD